jgi:hypothetical protein
MSRLKFVRYGIASALVLTAAGMSASCVSGSLDSTPGGDLGTGGQQGTAATGNVGTGNTTSVAGAGTAQAGKGGTTGSSTAGAPSGGSITGGSTSGGSTSGGSTSTQAGASSSAGAAHGGATSQAGSGSGGASAGAGGKPAGGATGVAGATGAAGSTMTGPQPPPVITGGTNGFATRYWDCCKPACQGNNLSCSSNSSSTDNGSSACSGGSAYMCYSFAPFQDSANKYISYAYAASHRACGSCWELQFTGSAGCSEGSTCPGNASALLYNTLYVQVINTGSIADDQFDLLIPGGGVGQFNACSNEWGTSDLGATYGGFLAGCNGSVSCTQTKCNTVFANKPDLLAGCNWFLGWYGASDNPQITFKQVSCPSQLTGKSGISG